MKRVHRLTKSADFMHVRRKGTSFAHPQVILVTLPNDLGKVRVGVAASKSAGGAVQRNRAKRILRAAMRPLLPRISPGHDISLIARRSTSKAKSSDLVHAIEMLLKEAKVI